MHDADIIEDISPDSVHQVVSPEAAKAVQGAKNTLAKDLRIWKEYLAHCQDLGGHSLVAPLWRAVDALYEMVMEIEEASHEHPQ